MKRILLSLVCVLIAVLLPTFLNLFTAPRGYVIHVFRQNLTMIPVWLMFALPAWVLLTPFIIWLKDTESWRGLIILILGIGFGPMLILILALARAPHHFNANSDGFPVAMAGEVSVTTTLLYFFLLRRMTRRRIQQTT
ncbi:MAG TPA: hypothetical protein VLI45_03500 [Acidobacteriaceae bacterium]|nr:hypothetical protein [Acidobacteriaceae bacterium]